MRVHILRVRKGVPGIGRKMGQWLNERGIETQEVTCGHRPLIKIQPEDFIFNYGRSEWPVWVADANPFNWLNTPLAVGNCVNKLFTLEILQRDNVPHVDWTTVFNVAENWSELDGARVFVRHIINGKKGRGIEIIERKCQVPEAPLYTKEFPSNPENKREFRVHVFKGKVIDYVQKKRMSAEKLAAKGYNRNEDVRNKANGWVFAHNNIIDSRLVRTIAVNAANALGMDYCGVDVLGEFDQEQKRIVNAKICEVNSAPGMSNTKTIAAYVNAIVNYVTAG